ncbi:MAG: DNA alkylation repair protein [Clostridiales Family XIII bacterium]|jgi:3-methyladenine DNA glycosylase AlkD|nr:DNA alkylation repair protein [Clostridiales Family XIII bacterium]
MFTDEDYAAVIQRFEELSDEKYRKFNEGLIPGTATAYGVRVPAVRAIAKDIAKVDPIGFLSVCKDGSFEEIQLHGMVISAMKITLVEKFPLLKTFIPLIDNWGICDTVSIKANQKDSSDEVSLLWDFLSDYFTSDKEFYIRFAVVIGMSNFITGKYIERYLERLTNITHEGYYVRMGVAWAACECFIKFREEALPIFERKSGGTLDPWTHNKAIQKCRESFRVTPEDKEYLKTLKI